MLQPETISRIPRIVPRRHDVIVLPPGSYFASGSHRVKYAGLAKTQKLLLRVEIAIEVPVLLFVRLLYAEVERTGSRRTEYQPVDELTFESRLKQATQLRFCQRHVFCCFEMKQTVRCVTSCYFSLRHQTARVRCVTSCYFSLRHQRESMTLIAMLHYHVFQPLSDQLFD